jgi:hypothetical protein
MDNDRRTRHERQNVERDPNYAQDVISDVHAAQIIRIGDDRVRLRIQWVDQALGWSQTLKVSLLLVFVL